VTVTPFGDILRIEDLPQHAITDIPGWPGVELLCRSLRGDERSEIERLAHETDYSRDPLAFRRLICQSCLINEDGSRYLPDDDATVRMFEKSSAATEYIFEQCCKHAGINKSDQEELEKN
jgi:hypothetical protein